MENIIPDQPKGCQSPIGAFTGWSAKDKKVVSGTLLCNSWQCDYCRPLKLLKLRSRIWKGRINQNAVSKHGLKFCTLTFGGKEKRDDPRYDVRNLEYLTSLDKPLVRKDGTPIVKWSGPIQYGSDGQKKRNLTLMYEDMAKAFHKLVTALKKRFGTFDYFRMYEPHKDRIPHYHILFAGNNIATRSFLDAIEKLWRFKYGFGFVRLNSIKKGQPGYGKEVKFNGAQHAINYVTKYLFKKPESPGKYKRIFSCSRGALERTYKMEWDEMHIYHGRVDSQGVHEEKIKTVEFMGQPYVERHQGDTLKMIPLEEYLTEVIERQMNHSITREV